MKREERRAKGEERAEGAVKTEERRAKEEERMENREERRAKEEERAQKAIVALRSRFILHRAGFRSPSSLFPLHPSRFAPGFTLLELLAVFIIIAVLAGAILGISKYAATNAATLRTKAEIATMETALESYKVDNGYYPSSSVDRNNAATSSSILVQALGGAQIVPCVGPSQGKVYFGFKRDQLKIISLYTYVCTNIFPCPPPPLATCTNIWTFIATNYCVVDPFGSPYNYYCNPGALDQTNRPTFDLWSYGPDGQNDTADDIVNWRR